MTEELTVTQGMELVCVITEAGRGYSIRLTRLVDDEAEYTLTYRGDVSRHASHAEASELVEHLAAEERLVAAMDFLARHAAQARAEAVEEARREALGDALLLVKNTYAPPPCRGTLDGIERNLLRLMADPAIRNLALPDPSNSRGEG